MLESILYLISMILCIVSLCMSYKKEKEVSMLKSIIISYITMQCIAGVAALGMSILNIPINLLSITVLYFSVSMLCILYSLKQRRIQKLKLYGYDMYL